MNTQVLVPKEIMCVDQRYPPMDMTQEWCKNDKKRSFSVYVLSYRDFELVRGGQRGSWWIRSSQYHLNIIQLQSYTKKSKAIYIPPSPILGLAKIPNLTVWSNYPTSMLDCLDSWTVRLYTSKTSVPNFAKSAIKPDA